MKQLNNLVWFILFISLVSCEKEKNSSDLLSYDNDYSTSPTLPAGAYEYAVRFPAAALNDHNGKTLSEFQWYQTRIPARCFIRVYKGSDGDKPGTLAYEFNATDVVQADRWNVHQISTPIAVGGEDLWLAVRFNLTDVRETVGCDAGPRKTNGDWFFDGRNTNWVTYLSAANTSINWNIRGKVQ